MLHSCMGGEGGLPNRLTPGYGHHRHDASPPLRSNQEASILVVPPGHPCRFSFPFFFFFLSTFFLLLLSFSVSVFPFLFRFFCLFVLSFFRLFLASPSSLFFSLPCSLWWRILLFCYFVSVLHPPRAACEPEVCVQECNKDNPKEEKLYPKPAAIPSCVSLPSIPRSYDTWRRRQDRPYP